MDYFRVNNPSSWSLISFLKWRSDNMTLKDCAQEHGQEHALVAFYGSLSSALWVQLSLSQLDSDFEENTSKKARQDKNDINAILPTPENNVAKVTNPIVEKLLKYGKGIARYKIIFLPEDNKEDPIRKLLNDQEWAASEHNWKMAEKRITNSFSFVIPENIKNLLTRYDKAIEEQTVGFESNINKISLVINENPFVKERTEYVFKRDWLLHWTQLVYTSL
ncbi:2310_t:CDS:2 [Acaulospora colombiana]|uniref:2310_t:CDS:1 n=1 Tax=Acaulospora colombiana TaxID=27376 RepID=A0ACA9K1X5_9GLOM|nr:2310_t:CDS:2 [Acaulospora colombiana]